MKIEKMNQLLRKILGFMKEMDEEFGTFVPIKFYVLSMVIVIVILQLGI